MNINEVFPSKYLKASDLQGRQVTVKIDRAEQELLGDDRKMILYFQGKEKGLVCNKTNANNIAAMYGPDTDNWQGQEVTLFEAMVDFQGKTVAAIRVRAPVRAPAAPKRQPQAEPAGPRADMDDEIPFAPEWR
jgi:arabinogalactan endo-1,4-beta-galactosidase